MDWSSIFQGVAPLDIINFKYMIPVTNKHRCKAKKFTTNKVILHGSIVCWGFESEPHCKHLRECVEANKLSLSTRKYNKIIKSLTDK